MRTDFSTSRPARPILYVDGTGGSLGKGIGHVELGSADFAGSCMQSRVTLSPLALYEGSDHALPLRANLSLSIDSFNALCARGCFERDDGLEIPCQPIVVGDMQGVKAMMGMAESSHSVWCKCRARVDIDAGAFPTQHDYGEPNQNFKSYAEMIEFFDRIGCEFKSEEFLLACAHLSKGLVHGERFTPFKCPCCGYQPNAVQAKADIASFEGLTDEEQQALRKAHVHLGNHHYVHLYMGPLTKGLPMNRCGVDQLHTWFTLTCSSIICSGTQFMRPFPIQRR